MPKIPEFTSKEKGFSHILVLLALVALVGLVVGAGVNTTKPTTPIVSSVSQSVLGENQQVVSLGNQQAVLAPCSGGGLTTAVYKDFQMQYTNESFLRVVNSKDLLKEVSQLKDLTCLQYLDATDQTVTGDIADLKKLTNLEVFSLYSNPEVTGDVCVLSGASKLRSLKFAFDPKVYGDISCLKGLDKMETFAMTYTQIKGDLSIFSNWPNLKAVYISGTNMSGDISSLAKLTNLEELGISDEYPGNPNIKGDLGSLKNLTKLKKVSLYSTKATNCEQFTKDHPNIEQGGCSKESLKTLTVHNIKAEKKIGKDRYTSPPPDYSKQTQGSPASDRRNEVAAGPVGQPNILQKFIMWVFGLFGKTPPQAPGGEGPRPEGRPPGGGPGNGSQNGPVLGPKGGPGGCKSQQECQAYCDAPGHQEECSKFAPAEGPNGPVEVIPDSQKGYCKTQEECDALIKKTYGK